MAAAVVSLLAQVCSHHRLRMADTARANAADAPAHSDTHAPVQRRLSWWQVLRHRQAWTFVLGKFEYDGFLPKCPRATHRHHARHARTCTPPSCDNRAMNDAALPPM